MPSSEKILVISDTHFGEKEALLRVGDDGGVAGRARVDGLIEWLAEQGPFKEIVLLGDIWELWTATLAEAREDAGYFLERLASLDFGQLFFLPGNHDHHLLIQHQMMEQIFAMRDDRDLEVPAHIQRRYTDSHLARMFPLAARDRFIVTYPDHLASVGGRYVVFHHGHHAAIMHQKPNVFAPGPLFIIQRLEEIGLHEVTRSDLELAGTILFELMYAFSLGERTRAKMNHLWERFLTLKRRVGIVSAFLLRIIQRRVNEVARGTAEQEVRSYSYAAERMLELGEQEHGEPIPCDAYIFGHTHRAGIVNVVAAKGRRFVLANAGTWLHEPAKRNAASEGTFLLLDPQHICLYRQGDDLSIRPLQIESWPDPWEPVEAVTEMQN